MGGAFGLTLILFGILYAVVRSVDVAAYRDLPDWVGQAVWLLVLFGFCLLIAAAARRIFWLFSDGQDR